MTLCTMAAGAVLLSVTVAAPSTALAQEVAVGPATYAVTLHHADLHPRTPRAARALLDRLDGATLEACGASSFSLREVKASVAASACWRDAMNDAVGRIGDPLLSATYHAQRRPVRMAGRAGS